jgi:hypothetical protein
MRRLSYGFLLLFGLWLLVGAIVPASRAAPERVAAIAGVVLVFALARRALGFGVRPEPELVPLYEYRELSAADEQDVRLARLDASIERAAESGEQFARATVPMLRRLAAQRLRDKSGIDVTADPAGGRRLMGEELWEIFSTEARADAPPPSPQRLRDLVERLEAL